VLAVNYRIALPDEAVVRVKVETAGETDLMAGRTRSPAVASGPGDPASNRL